MDITEHSEGMLRKVYKFGLTDRMQKRRKYENDVT